MLRYFLYFAVFCGAATAQSLPSEQRTNGSDLRAAFAPVEQELAKSVVAFYDRNHKKGRVHRFFGTVMSEDGYVLAKSSTLLDEGDYFVRIGGEKYDGKVEIVGRSEEWDLALVKIPLPEGTALTPPDWTETVGLPEGLWVVQAGSVTRRGPRARMGVLSGGRREIDPAPSTIGITLDVTANNLVIEEVAENGPAAAAGLQVGDVILQVGTKQVSSVIEFYETLQETQPGDELSFIYARDGEETDVTMTLAARTDIYGIEMTRNDGMSGRFSFRREDFPVVIQYDTHASPRSVGGPLLNLKGRCLGITIARVDRVTTFAIPSEEIPAIVEQLKGEQGAS